MNLDERSQMALYRLMNRKAIGSIGHPIREGKESLVLHGLAPDGRELAIKVHTSKVFGKGEKKQYLFGDWRFRHATKKIVLRAEEMWAEKEQRNLARIEKKGIPAPQVLGREENIVVMSFLGENGVAAPQLSRLQNADFVGLANSVLGIERDLVLKARLVHGDLSEYNILVWEKNPFIIDLSQAVLTTHPDASSLLTRDCERITDFFTKRGLDSNRFNELRDELLQEIDGPDGERPPLRTSDLGFEHE